MTDEEFEKLIAQARQEAERTRLPSSQAEDTPYAMLARHAEFGACAH
ncbi:hypothetical protein ABZ299_25350 [Streptomyces sp. NPDC006184]